MLDHPSGTTVRFGLLLTTVVLSGVFVGDWLHRSVVGRAAADVPAAYWLVGTPVAVVVLGGALTLLAPRWKERRGGLVPVPAGRLAVAHERFRQLAVEAGVRHLPELRWNPHRLNGSAAAYGRPGRYRLAVAPALLACARRRPALFDATVRHELAHIRNGDVGLAYAAVCAWYALVPFLAAPVVVAGIAGDLSLLPDFAWRVAIVAGTVYLTRAAVLRTREHYADVSSATFGPDAEADLAAALGGQDGVTPPPAPGRPAPWFRMHPSLVARRAVLRDPAVLGRLSPVEFLFVGLAAGAGIPLLALAVASLPPVDPLQASKIARAALLGLAGAYAGATLLRAAGTHRSSPATTGAAAVALAAGLAVGMVTSLNGTPWVQYVPGEALGAAASGLFCGAVMVWFADLCRLVVAAGIGGRAPHAALVVLAALGFGGAGLATYGFAVLGSYEPSFVWEYLSTVLSMEDAAVWLAVGSALMAGVVMPAATARLLSREVLVVLGAALAAALVVALALVVLRMRVEQLGTDAWDHYRASLWLVVVAAAVAATAATIGATGARAVAGVAASVLAAAAGALVHVGVTNAFGGRYNAGETVTVMRDMTALAVLAGLAVAAVASVLGGGVPDAGRSRRLVPAALAALAVSAPVLVALAYVVPDPDHGGVPGEGGAVSVDAYLSDDLPYMLAQRDAAFFRGQEAEVFPTVSVGDDLRRDVLPLYDALIDEAATIEPPPELGGLHAAALGVFRAERALFRASADRSDTPGPESQRRYEEAVAAANAAMARWKEESGAVLPGSSPPAPGSSLGLRRPAVA